MSSPCYMLHTILYIYVYIYTYIYTYIIFCIHSCLNMPAIFYRQFSVIILTVYNFQLTCCIWKLTPT